MSDITDALKQGVLMGCAVLALVLPPRQSASFAPHTASQVASTVHRQPRFADFGGEEASPEARIVAQWAVETGDNRNMFFVIVDKKNARVYVFEPHGKLQGATPVLLGLAPGDDSVEGIGQRPIAEVRPEERTTPAGRFVAEPGRNATGEDVVWVDYSAAVSMHRVRALEPKERRLERLASPTSADNRISYGCINVPVKFYEEIVKPAFNGRYGVVYVLPETKPLREVFAAAFELPRSPMHSMAKM
jgi:hypothetical protein